MPPFVYQPYTNPYVQSISELMLRQGDVQAQGLQNSAAAIAQGQRASGQAYGQGIAGAGQDIGQTIQQQTNPQRVLAQQQVNDLRTLDRAYNAASNAGSEDEFRQRVIRGLPGHLQGSVASSFAQADEARAKLNESNLKAEDATNQYVFTLADGIKAHDYDPTALQLALAHAKATFRTNPSLLGQIAPIEAALHANPTPEGVQAIVDPIIKAHEAQEKPVILPATPRGGAPPQLVKPSTGQPIATGQPAPAAPPTEPELALRAAGGDPVGAMALLKPGTPVKPGTVEDWVSRARRMAVANNGGKPLSDAQQLAVDTAAVQDFKQQDADPAVRAAALAQKDLAIATARLNLSQQPTKEDAIPIAQGLLSHTIAPSQLMILGGFGTSGQTFKRMIINEALKTNPSFNFEEAESEYNLVKSPSFQNTIRIMDATTASMPRLLENAKALGNSNVTSINALINQGKANVSNVDLKKFKTDIVFVGDEIAKILTGGGTGSVTSDAKLKQAQDIFSTSDNAKAIAGALEEAQALIGNRRGALTHGTYLEGSTNELQKTQQSGIIPGFKIERQ